jgi:hypothetical protein
MTFGVPPIGFVRLTTIDCCVHLARGWYHDPLESGIGGVGTNGLATGISTGGLPLAVLTGLVGALLLRALRV